MPSTGQQAVSPARAGAPASAFLERDLAEKNVLIQSLLQQIRVRDTEIAELKALIEAQKHLVDEIGKQKAAPAKSAGAAKPAAAPKAPTAAAKAGQPSPAAKPAQPPAAKPAQPAAVPAAPRTLRVFDGINGEKITLQQMVKPPFTIGARFLSHKSDEDDFAMGETTPPMPFVISQFALYRIDNDTLRVIVGPGSKRDWFDFSDDSAWADIRLVVDRDTTRVIANGKVIGQCKSPEGSAFNQISLGRGHRNRGWKGMFDTFWIKCTADKDGGAAAPSPFDADLAFLFDGTSVAKS